MEDYESRWLFEENKLTPIERIKKHSQEYDKMLKSILAAIEKTKQKLKNKNK